MSCGINYPYLFLLRQDSMPFTDLLNVFHTLYEEKQAVPPPRRRWVSILLMSPTQTHGRLRSRLMAHLAWSLVVVKSSSSTSTKSISSTFSTMKGLELEVETKVYMKVRNHGEGLLIKSDR